MLHGYHVDEFLYPTPATSLDRSPGNAVCSDCWECCSEYQADPLQSGFLKLSLSSCICLVSLSRHPYAVTILSKASIVL